MSNEILPPTIIKPKRWRSRIVAMLCWGYLLTLLTLIAAIRIGGDRNWRCTLLIFGPRWAALLPLIVLLPLAVLFNRRVFIPLTLSTVAAIFPLMGFGVGLHRFIASPVDGMPVRVLAFNLHHVQLDGADAIKFFNDIHADVVAMEEIPPTIPNHLFLGRNWHVIVRGELMIASRYPIVSFHDLDDDSAVQARLQTSKGPIDFVVVHLSSPHFALRDAVQGKPNGRQALTTNIQQRAQGAAALSDLAARSIVPLIIAGDFNLTFDSRLFRGNFPGLTDSFEAAGFGFGWTYQNQWTDVRIDHVLSSNSFNAKAFWTGPRFGSPHFPIVADLVLKPQE